MTPFALSWNRRPFDPSQRSDSLGLWALLLAVLQLALGVLAGRFHELGSWGSETDFYGMYAPGAAQLLDGEAYGHTRSGPGYSGLLAGLSWLTSDLFAAGKAIAAVSVALLGLCTYWTLRAFTFERAALLAQALVYVSLFRFSFAVGNDVPAAALSWASLCLLFRRARPTGVHASLAGACAGLAIVTRYPAAATIVPAFVLLFLRPLFEPVEEDEEQLEGEEAGAGGRVRTAAILCSLWLAGFFVTSGPVWIANLRWHGDPFHSTAHALVALEAYGAPGQKLDGETLAQLEQEFTSFADVIMHDPRRFARVLAEDFYLDAGQLMVDLVTFPAFLFLGPGLLLLLLRRFSDPWRGAALIVYACVGFGLSALAPYQSRYHFAILPALLGALSCAWLVPWSHAGEGEDQDDAELAGAPVLRRMTLAAVLLSAFVIGALSALRASETLSSEPRELLEVAPVLAREAGDEDGISARKPHLSWMARVRPVPFYGAPSIERFVARLADLQATFVYIGPQEVATAPVLEPLARGHSVPAGLEPVMRTDQPASTLYRVLPAKGR